MEGLCVIKGLCRYTQETDVSNRDTDSFSFFPQISNEQHLFGTTSASTRGGIESETVSLNIRVSNSASIILIAINTRLYYRLL